MIDPDRDTVTVDRCGAEGGFTDREQFDAVGGVLTTTLLPGWSLALATLFE